jgi:hypothetical protein
MKTDMTLAHQLLVTLNTIGFAFLFAWLLPGLGIEASFGAVYWSTLPIAFCCALIAPWPISRLFNLRPLMIFAGPCPGCGTRPPGWWATETTRNSLILKCDTCGELVHLWLTRTVPRGNRSTTAHVYRLRWPEFLGIWSEVKLQNPGVTEGIT